jgi:hypothetical protein
MNFAKGFPLLVVFVWPKTHPALRYLKGIDNTALHYKTLSALMLIATESWNASSSAERSNTQISGICFAHVLHNLDQFLDDQPRFHFSVLRAPATKAD